MANRFENKRETDHLVMQILKAINANQRHYGSMPLLMVLGRMEVKSDILEVSEKGIQDRRL